MKLEDFKDLSIMGEIKEEKGEIYYEYITDITDEEAADDLWDTYCEDMAIIRERFPDLETRDSWADNDTTSCTIVKI